MRCGLLALTFIAMVSAGADAARPEPVRAGQDSFIQRAIFADGRLWLLTDAGVLSTIADGKDERVAVALPEPALDLWLEHGRPAVITCRRNGCTDWTIREWIGGTWAVTAKVPTADDSFIAMSSTDAGPMLLSSRRIIEVTGKTQRATALSQPVQGGVVPGTAAIPTMQVGPTSILVGFNAGEWGGGVQRIDRQTGEVSTIPRSVVGKSPYEPFDLDFNPVNGIVAVPWKPACVAVAVGLVHFEPHGAIVELCGNVISPLYVKAYGGQPGEALHNTGSTVAFFGLVRRGDSLWAAGIDGIYRIGPDGATQPVPLPAFKKVGGVSVSFEIPDFVVVLTDVNQRRSMGGSVPLLVPR